MLGRVGFYNEGESYGSLWIWYKKMELCYAMTMVILGGGGLLYKTSKEFIQERRKDWEVAGAIHVQEKVTRNLPTPPPPHTHTIKNRECLLTSQLALSSIIRI